MRILGNFGERCASETKPQAGCAASEGTSQSQWNGCQVKVIQGQDDVFRKRDEQTLPGQSEWDIQGQEIACPPLCWFGDSIQALGMRCLGGDTFSEIQVGLPVP